MANLFYDQARHDLSTAQLDLATANIYAVLLVAGYTYSRTDSGLGPITPYLASGMTPQLLTGIAVSSSGNVTADSSVFAGVTSGQTVAAVVLYVDQGAGRFDLLLYYDAGMGFPLVTTGADITVDWNATAL